MKKNIISRLLDRMNYRWQNFIEDMFGMGNFSCTPGRREKKVNKN